MAKTWAGAPFGTSTERFSTNGVHPKNLLPGTFLCSENSVNFSNPEMGPGKYDPDNEGFHARAVAKRASGPGWKREEELANMTAIPYLLNKEYWQAQKMLHRELGPGKYEPYEYEDKCKTVSKRGLMSLRQKRFKESSSQDTPGPGTYGYPDQLLAEKSKKSLGKYGILDRGTERTIQTVGSDLGPGQYKTAKGTVDELLDKKCSNRGPYDLFTGERSDVPVVGHLATMPPSKLGPGTYEYRSFVEDHKGRDLKKHGKFGTVAQYPRKPVERMFFRLENCPREPSDPGPGAYEIMEAEASQKRLTQGSVAALPPFNSSTRRDDKHSIKLFTNNYNLVGVGRYDLHKFHDHQDVNGCQGVFQSKTGRPNLARDKFIGDRLRATNIPPEQRTFCGADDPRKNWFDQNKNTARCQPENSYRRSVTFNA